MHFTTTSGQPHMGRVVRRVWSRMGSLWVTTLLAVIGLFVLAPSAWAMPSSVPDETWVTDGRVYSIVQSGNRVYLGGLFRQVGPNVGNGASLSATDGQRDTAFPRVDGKIWATVPDGSGGWYIGGEFSKVGSSDRSRLAHIRADGQVDSNWNPGANGTVRALALSPDAKRLYVGGGFTQVAGGSRSRAAAVDTTTGAFDPRWNPRANNSVFALAVSTDGKRIYLGGSFTTLAGGAVSRSNLAVVDNDTGAADSSWNPSPNGAVNALAISGNSVYAGGAFTSVGSTPRNYLAAMDSTTGTVDSAFNPNANNVVNALAISSNRVYAGGSFTSVGGQTRNRLAAIDTATGVIDPAFNPNANNTVNALALSGGKLYAGGTFTALGTTTRYRIAAVDAATGIVTGWDPKANNAVYALAPSSDGSRIYAGGALSSVNGVSRDRLAAIDATTGAVDPTWNPKASSTVYALAVSSDGSRVYAGGNFTLVGGHIQNRLAAIDATTGALDPQWKNVGANNYVRSLAASGNSVYLGGDFTTVNGQSRTRLARVDGVSGVLDPNWKPTADNSVLSFYPSSDGTTVYVGGAFSNINAQARRYVWALDSVTGVVVPSWQPNFAPIGPVEDIEVADTGSGRRVYTAEGGSNGLGVYDALTGTRVTIFRGDGDVQCLALLDGKLYAGGHFVLLGGQTHRYFAALDLGTNRLDTQWLPTGVGHAGPWALTPDPVRKRLYAGGDFTNISGRLQQGFAQFSEQGTP